MLGWLKSGWAVIRQAIIREPVQIAGGAAALIQFISSQYWPLTVGEQGALNATVVAVLGFVAAASVSAERGVPAFAGLLQAVVALAAAFDLQLPAATQVAAGIVVSMVTAMFVRTQVVAHGVVDAGGKHESHSLMQG